MLRLDDVSDHAGDVVRSAGLVGQIDQLIDGLLRIAGRAQDVPASADQGNGRRSGSTQPRRAGPAARVDDR